MNDLLTQAQKAGRVLRDDIRVIAAQFGRQDIFFHAGSVAYSALLAMIPFARAGFIGIYRDKFINNTVEYYFKMPPDISGKMALLISHRFSTVRMADSILVLSDGRIAEEGNHGELSARGGLYSEMFELQAASYR